jgi:hypothetical protein
LNLVSELRRASFFVVARRGQAEMEKRHVDKQSVT